LENEEIEKVSLGSDDEEEVVKPKFIDQVNSAS